MADLVTTEIQDNIATLTMDDGKANVLSLAMLQAINNGLDHAIAKQARAVVLRGRPGMLSAGFDLKVIQGKDAKAREAMRDAGFALFDRLFLLPQPLIVACTGHAVAGGGFLLLVADQRIGIAGDFKLGLNEVAIGRPMPERGIAFVRERLAATAISELLLQAKLYAPDDAVRVGYLDEITTSADFDAVVHARATTVAQLDAIAYAETKRRLREPVLNRMPPLQA